jgi:hypothetical protein
LGANEGVTAYRIKEAIGHVDNFLEPEFHAYHQ